MSPGGGDETTTQQRNASADKPREGYAGLGGYHDVQVEEYTGGDMTIYTQNNEPLYLTSEQASGLRSALGQIDADKRGDGDGD